MPELKVPDTYRGTAGKQRKLRCEVGYVDDWYRLPPTSSRLPFTL